MADLFGRQTDLFGGSFAVDGAMVTFADLVSGTSIGTGAGPAGGGVGLLTQTITVAYQQMITRLYEIGTNFHFFVSGRTQGNAGLNRVLGPRPIQVAFYQKFGNVCFAATNNIKISLATGCASPGAFAASGSVFAFDLLYNVINQLTIAVNVQDMLFNEAVSLMFCSLRLSNQGGQSTLTTQR